MDIQLPSLIILDAELTEGDLPQTMQLVKAQWSEARCIFLADDVQQQQKAESAGVDAALLKGAPPANITATVARLLA